MGVEGVEKEDKASELCQTAGNLIDLRDIYQNAPVQIRITKVPQGSQPIAIHFLKSFHISLSNIYSI